MARKDPDAFVDPQTKITKFNFERDEEVDERSRVDSYDELVLLTKKEVMHRMTGVKVYAVICRSHMHLKISKDGKSRQEAVDSLRATNDPMKGINTGFTVVEQAIDDQKGAR